MHRTGSVQWTWIKTAEDHYDTIAMNECRMIRAHSAHLDLPKPKKSCANAKNEHGKFMTIQCTRTTAPKDSADKSTLLQEMIAKCSQSSVTQEPSIAHHNYEERSRRWRWIRRRNNAHMVYSPFATQEAPPGSQRTEEKWRRTETESQLAIKCPPVKIGAQCQHSNFANSSPGSEWPGTSMMSSWSPHSWLEASIVPMQINPFPTEIFTSQSACSYCCPPWSPHPQLITFQLHQPLIKLINIVFTHIFLKLGQVHHLDSGPRGPSGSSPKVVHQYTDYSTSLLARCIYCFLGYTLWGSWGVPHDYCCYHFCGQVH